MKTQYHVRRWLSITVMTVIAGAFSACDDDEAPKTLPEVTTSPMSAVTATTAVGGGEIAFDGNATVTASGLVYSSANATPTLADSKTDVTATSGAFTSQLEGLSSGTTYHVRAYATNTVGTAYGAVVTFTTGNAAPTVTNISISGTVQVGEQLTATYTYSDTDNDPESGTTFQWYRANDGTGSGETAISGATELTYMLQEVDEFKFVRIGVLPKAATGVDTGIEVKSTFVGPVAEEPNTVTFTYNGETVTYGIIISPTGRKWLDRNLGAPNAPTAVDDYANYGDTFQYGRAADGHQLVIRASTAEATTGVNGTTTTLSSTDTPPNALFITPTDDLFDWRNSRNDELWQGVNGINNPCPAGWRIPTRAEFEAENLTSMAIAYDQLKITFGGYRSGTSGLFVGTGTSGTYWTSTLRPNGRPTAFYPDTNSYFGDIRAIGGLCRCIKD